MSNPHEEYIKTIIKNAYIELLSGIAEIHDGGIKSVDWFGHECYIHFPDPTDSKRVTIRYYWESGSIRWEKDYYDGKGHGRSIGWRQNGDIWWDHECRNGRVVNRKFY